MQKKSVYDLTDTVHGKSQINHNIYIMNIFFIWQKFTL